MKFRAQKRLFSEAFAKAAIVCPSRSPKEVLQSVLVTATNDMAQLTANNLETGVRLQTEADIIKPGKALLPQGVVSNILRESSSEEIEFDLDDKSSRLTVCCGSSQFIIPTRNPDEYPAPEFSTDGNGLSFAPADLVRAIGNTAFATDPDSTRFALGGVLFEGDNVVGTDGRRLSHCVLPLINDDAENFNAILPTSSAHALAKLANGDTGMLWANTSSITYSDENIEFYARQVEGRFPNWRNVIPDTVGGEHSSFAIPAGTLNSLVRQASIMADKETRGVDFQIDGRLMTVKASGSDIGKSSIQYDFEEAPGNISVRVDCRFLIQFLDKFSAEEVTVHYLSSTQPVVIRESTFTYVLMPMAQG